MAIQVFSDPIMCYWVSGSRHCLHLQGSSTP